MYFEQFKTDMGQLFAKIKAKEDDATQKIEQFDQKSNLKAFIAAQKRLLNQFGYVSKKVDVDFIEIAKTKMAAVKETKTSEKTKCLKDMQEIHSKIETTLKDNQIIYL